MSTLLIQSRRGKVIEGVACQLGRRTNCKHGMSSHSCSRSSFFLSHTPVPLTACRSIPLSKKTQHSKPSSDYLLLQTADSFLVISLALPCLRVKSKPPWPAFLGPLSHGLHPSISTQPTCCQAGFLSVFNAPGWFPLQALQGCSLV